jgi:hypothetical protein
MKTFNMKLLMLQLEDGRLTITYLSRFVISTIHEKEKKVSRAPGVLYMN